MAQLALNKTSLHKESERLRTFQRFLPTLDLKRKQLLMERAKAAAAYRQTARVLEEARGSIAAQLPMLSNELVDLTELAFVKEVEVGRENVVGVYVPILKSLKCEIRSYGYLARPHWVDAVAVRLKEVLELRVRVQVDRRRYELLEAAARKITQRVNLFEKVLIPRTKQSIKRIRLFLSDAERISVVQAKIAKAKQAVETHR